MSLEELYMNLRYNIIFFLCFFPIFIIKSNLNFFELFLVLIFFLILCFLNFFFLKILENKKRVYQAIYQSLIIVYGLDNHLGLFNGLIQSNIVFFLKYFDIIYIPSLIVLFILFISIFFLRFNLSESKISIIFITTLLTLLIFNIFDNTKSYKKIPYFKKVNTNTFDKTTLVMIWDEMSGFNSLSSKSDDGSRVNDNFEKLFQKFNFDYYTRSNSISRNSVASITSLINFKDELNPGDKKFVKPSKNYFIEYEVNRNLFFENFKSISVIQNIHLNFCNHDHVFKCYQYNPFKLDIIDAQVDSFSNIISSWALNGSIASKFVWRFLKQINFITSTLEPEGEKLFVKNILNYSRDEILSKKYDLVFMHLLVPHQPYGFNKNCKYSAILSNLNIFMTKDEKIKQHNIERNCVIEFIDQFLKKVNPLDNFRIIILSDHGSRITNEDNSALSTIFAHKDFKKTTFNRISNELSIQTIFKQINNE